MIWISGTRKIDSGTADSFRQQQRLRAHGAVMIAELGVIEHEGDIAVVAGTWPPGLGLCPVVVVLPADLPSDLCRDLTDIPLLGTAIAGECALLISVDRDLLDMQKIHEFPICRRPLAPP
jgi:hypothetical protein